MGTLQGGNLPGPDKPQPGYTPSARHGPLVPYPCTAWPSPEMGSLSKYHFSPLWVPEGLPPQGAGLGLALGEKGERGLGGWAAGRC